MVPTSCQCAPGPSGPRTTSRAVVETQTLGVVMAPSCSPHTTATRYRSGPAAARAVDRYLYLVDGTNLPIEPRGVLLISPDPASPNGLRMAPVAVLSVEDHVRYREAYRR